MPAMRVPWLQEKALGAGMHGDSRETVKYSAQALMYATMHSTMDHCILM